LLKKQSTIMRFFILITAIAGLAAASPIMDVEQRDSKPDPNQVYIESTFSDLPQLIISSYLWTSPLTLPVEVSWAGTGCPPGSVDYRLLESATLVSLAFSEYVAATGPNEPAKDARKNCDVRVTLHYPQGWSWTVASTDLRGYAQIPDKCSGRVGATYFFSGQQQEVRMFHPLNPCRFWKC
jgi:hypothetical protein